MALAAIRGEKTLAELAQQFDMHPNQIMQWRAQLLDGASRVFGEAAKAETAPVVDVKTLYAKIGELTLENDPSQGLRGPTGATVPASISGALGSERRNAIGSSELRTVCCRAQGDDRPQPPAQHQPAGEGARD